MKEELLKFIDEEIKKDQAAIDLLDIGMEELNGSKIELANFRYGAINALSRVKMELMHSIKYNG